MSDQDNSTPATRGRAAQYVRMSTEHQQYSTANQQDALAEYAARRGLTIVRTYADEGKSGLSFAGRTSLQRLIADVQAGQADFSVILVYDVSRWGRFQDADESAYYEYLCKRAGIEVHYCAEQFENDGGPTSTIIKSVKRAMAGEYSRELSSKVFKGQCRLIELGFRQGGSPGFGLRRMLVNATGDAKGVLTRGEQKSLQMDRVILVPGPEEEVQVVRQIYDWFTNEGKQVLTAFQSGGAGGVSRRSKLAAHKRAALEFEKMGASAPIFSNFAGRHRSAIRHGVLERGSSAGADERIEQAWRLQEVRSGLAHAEEDPGAR